MPKTQLNYYDKRNDDWPNNLTLSQSALAWRTVIGSRVENAMDEQEYFSHNALNLPDDWWRSKDAIDVLTDWFRRYLIGLFVEVKYDNQTHRVMCSGFLLNYRNYMLWITAGHVIDELLELTKNDRYSINTIRWADNFPVEGAESIPLHEPNLHKLSVSFTDLNIDFGFVFLIGLDRENLIKNADAEIMDPRGWHNLQAAIPEGYYILGYPNEWTKYEEGTNLNGQVLNKFEAIPACLPVTKIPCDSKYVQTSFMTEIDDFCGQIEPFSDDTPHQLSDIIGMSGGPLLSIERTESGEMRYRLFGIQKSWDKDKQIIQVEPIQRIVKLLDLTLDELESLD